jgi:hypothetical protein
MAWIMPSDGYDMGVTIDENPPLKGHHTLKFLIMDG